MYVYDARSNAVQPEAADSFVSLRNSNRPGNVIAELQFELHPL
jgi:hypothetical protein